MPPTRSSSRRFFSERASSSSASPCFNSCKCVQTCVTELRLGGLLNPFAKDLPENAQIALAPLGVGVAKLAAGRPLLGTAGRALSLRCSCCCLRAVRWRQRDFGIGEKIIRIIDQLALQNVVVVIVVIDAVIPANALQRVFWGRAAAPVCVWRCALRGPLQRCW